MFKDSPDYQIPAAIAERPELGILDSFYLSEFYILSTERVNAMAEGAIPVTKIRKRAEQIGDDDVEMYEQIILQCDTSYLSMRAKQADEESKKGGK